MKNSDYYRFDGPIKNASQSITPDWPMAAISANIMTPAFIAQSSLNLYDNNGTLTPSAGFAATAMIPVSAKQILFFYNGDGSTPPASHGCFYDSNLSLIAVYTPNNTGAATVPTNAAFARVNYQMGYTPVAYTFDSIDSLMSGDWNKRYRITFAGDSITEGFGLSTQSQRWASILADRLGFKDVTNLGLSGTTLSTFSGAPTPFADRILTNVIPWDTQVFVMKYGINDVGTAPGGTLGTTSDTTSATIYGALDVVAKYMQEKRPLARTYFVKPLRANRNPAGSLTIDQVWAAIDYVASKYQITVIDMNGCGVRKNQQISSLYGKFGGASETFNFLHPGAYGHALMAEHMARSILHAG